MGIYIYILLKKTNSIPLPPEMEIRNGYKCPKEGGEGRTGKGIVGKEKKER